jgi:hypothetical protein
LRSLDTMALSSFFSSFFTAGRDGFAAAMVTSAFRSSSACR